MSIFKKKIFFVKSAKKQKKNITIEFFLLKLKITYILHFQCYI